MLRVKLAVASANTQLAQLPAQVRQVFESGRVIPCVKQYLGHRISRHYAAAYLHRVLLSAKDRFGCLGRNNNSVGRRKGEQGSQMGAKGVANILLPRL